MDPLSARRFEELMIHFCRKIEPKLSELEDFRRLEEFKDLAVSCRTQLRAVVRLLKWQDDGALEVSKGFREFYDGLLFFSNIQRAVYSTRIRALLELVNIFFEIHGSDPRNFPDTMKTGLRLFHQALTKQTLPREEDSLWDVLAEASSLGSHAAELLQMSLNYYAEKMGLYAGNYYCEGLKCGEMWSNFGLPLPFTTGFLTCAKLAQKTAIEDVRAWLESNQSREHQALNKDQFDLEKSLGPAPEAMERELNAELLTTDSEAGGYFQIYVGPSGCGKTAKIHSLLKQHWGLYLLPGNLRNASGELELQHRLEYKPRSNGGSRETQTWLKDLISLRELGLGVDSVAVSVQARLVLAARLWILEQFRALDTNGTAGDWLKVQTNCWKPQNDIFNHLYRVVRFANPSKLKPEIALDSKLIFCFDEAQCDLSPLSPTGLEWPYAELFGRAVSPLGCMNIAAFDVNSRFNVRKDMEVFLSGTALQLHHIQREIKTNAHMMALATQELTGTNILSAYSDFAPKVSHDFKVVENEKHFRNLVEARKYHYDPERLNMIIRHSERLRGRVVWSVCYLDEMENFIHRQGHDQNKVLDNHVKEISVRVYEKAKKGLKERLEDMRQARPVVQQTGYEEEIAEAFFRILSQSHSRPSEDLSGDLPNSSVVETSLPQHPMAVDQQLQHEVLIHELCSLAIRSDLLGEATVFQSPESADLVAFGFAFLEEPQGSSGSQVILKERLAVDAVIEYFQSQRFSNGQSEYDRALINFLYAEQSNASALGKVAELFFAWHLKKVLGRCADMIIPTPGDDYQMQVLQQLVGNAQTVKHLESGGGGSDARSKLADHANFDNLTGFRLVGGRRTAYQEEVDKERTINMWGWLRAIRNGIEGDDLQSTFWFPSNTTGPDVLFALRREMPGALKKETPANLERKTTEGTTSLPHCPVARQQAEEKRKRTSDRTEALNYSLVLCAVQIKRERKISDVGRAIATTDPNYWFSNSFPHHTRDALEITKELREWQEGRYPIVRILVSALTDPNQYNTAEKGPTTAERYFKNKASEDTLVKEGRRENLQEVRIPSHQQYFTSIGAEHDDLLFGDAFRRLRKAQGIETTRERRGEA